MLTFVFYSIGITLFVGFILNRKHLAFHLTGYLTGLLFVYLLYSLAFIGIMTPAQSILLIGYSFSFAAMVGALAKNIYWLIGSLIPILWWGKISVGLTEGIGKFSLINLPDSIACGACGGAISSLSHYLLIFIIPILTAGIAFGVKRFLITRKEGNLLSSVS